MDRWLAYHIDVLDDQGGITAVRICGEEDDGQYAVVAFDEFGPFDTALDISAWMVKWITRDVKRHRVGYAG